MPKGLALALVLILTPAPRTVKVVGLDYAFQIPSEVPSGPTVFRFTNSGKVRHELNIFLIKAGVTMDSVMALLRADQSTRDVSDGPVGVLFARRADSSAGGLYVDLLPDRDYAVICIMRDNAQAPRHYMLGMYAVIHVRHAPAQAAVRRETRPIDTIVGMDYAFRYPVTLPPGHRAFAFRNDGKVRHEMSVVGLKGGITLDSLLRTEKAGGNVGRLIDADFGLLAVWPGRQALGMLEADLVAGKDYVLFCFLTDSAGAPPHASLGMFGAFHVAPRP